MVRRVVITGLGMVSPLGLTVTDSWQKAVAGTSGIAIIDSFDSSSLSVRIAGEVKGFSIENYLSSKDARKMDRFIHLGLAAAIQALRDAGLENASEKTKEMTGVCIGAGIGGLMYIESSTNDFFGEKKKKPSPFFVPASIINMISGHLSIRYGFQGPNYSVVTACSTGAHCIGSAAYNIFRGEADVMVAGGSEACICAMGVSGFASMKALSTQNEHPEMASCPWNATRDGFVLGEGAGVLVLEEYEHAKARGASIYCELVGFGMTADAHHMTAPLEDGSGAARCMQLALRSAALNPDQIHYINAHGTSTPLGDLAETIAVKRVFGEYAYKLPMSSTKSVTGHLLGAAGGIEAVFSVLALHHQIIPPTANLTEPDPKCDLDYVPNEARHAKLEAVMSNSFAFGGTNATIVLKML